MGMLKRTELSGALPQLYPASRNATGLPDNKKTSVAAREYSVKNHKKVDQAAHCGKNTAINLGNGLLSQFKSLMTHVLPSPAKPVVEEIEMDDMSGRCFDAEPSVTLTHKPFVTPANKSPERLDFHSDQGGKPKLKVQFNEGVKILNMPNGGKVQLNRKAYSDMQILRTELQAHMKQLKAKCLEFPKGDVREFVQEALNNHRNAQPDENALVSSISNLLRDIELPSQPQTSEQLSSQVFGFVVALNGMDRSLKVAQEEMQFMELPEDADLETARGCLQEYSQTLEQLLPETSSFR
jgi:hypothetical protein